MSPGCLLSGHDQLGNLKETLNLLEGFHSSSGIVTPHILQDELSFICCIKLKLMQSDRAVLQHILPSWRLLCHLYNASKFKRTAQYKLNKSKTNYRIALVYLGVANKIEVNLTLPTMSKKESMLLCKSSKHPWDEACSVTNKCWCQAITVLESIENSL